MRIYEILELDKVMQLVKPYAMSELTYQEIDNARPSFNADEVSLRLNEVEEAYEVYYKYNSRPITRFYDVAEILEKAKIGSTLQIFQLRAVLHLLKSGRIAQKSVLSCPISAQNVQNSDKFAQSTPNTSTSNTSTSNAPTSNTSTSNTSTSNTSTSNASESKASQSNSSESILKNIANSYISLTELENEINTAVLSDTELNDFASPKLREIRRKLATANQKLKEKLNSFTRNSQISKYLQDNLVTLRNGRYVVPVKSECRANVAGLIHDRSATGATLFIEPFAMVDLNNEIKALQMDESAEIERILIEFTQKVGENSQNIANMQSALVRLDYIFARLRFCVDYDCVKPRINLQGYINLLASRHPLIKKEKVVPVTISLGGESPTPSQNHLTKNRILTITGPNTGGKTVCLKTVGLFCLLAYCGFFIPAKEGSELSIFDNIFADIGDEQSIASSLSTFSAHILNISRITNSITRNSLVLLDELGAGTDPSEGAGLAIGVVKFIQKVGCCAVITTHYSELKEYALTSGGIINASMQFNEETLSPTYRLIMGLPGASNALKIAKNLGMNEEILASAYESMPEQKLKFEAILSSAENVKRRSLEELARYESERRAVEQLRLQLVADKKRLDEKLESINANAKAEVIRLVAKSMDKVNDMIDELKEELKTRDEKALLDAKRTLKRIEDTKYELEREDFDAIYQNIDANLLKEGDSVVIKSLGTVGKVVKIDRNKKEATVLAGAGMASVRFENLAKPLEKSSAKKTRGVSKIAKTEYTSQSKEVKVLGMTVFEAIEEIEPYIESFVSCGGGILRIIHGKGTGALGRGIQQYLKSNKCVSAYRYAGFGEGDAGVTIAEIGAQS